MGLQESRTQLSQTNQQGQRKCYPEVASVKRVGWRMTLFQENLKRLFFIILKKLT